MKNRIIKTALTIVLFLTAGYSINVFINENVVETSAVYGGVGQTIATTFSDSALAQLVADNVSSGDVNAILTQTMVDGLTKLDGRDSYVADLSGIDVLTNLQDLYIRGQFTSIPDSIGNLVNLVNLTLIGPFSSVPNTIDRLVNLKILQLFGKLSIISDSIYNLTGLGTLALGGNITSVTDGISRLVNLTYLDLGYNKITSLSDEISNISGLTSLKLNNNQLTRLPNNFGNLTNLVLLELNNNEITVLPDNFGDLGNLGLLRLDKNQLAKLPESFGKLSTLFYCTLDNNQLTSLPSNFGSLRVSPGLSNNLLPTDYTTTLDALGLISTTKNQRQLLLQSEITTSYSITNENDFNNVNNLDFLSMVKLSDQSNVSPSHKFILDNYVDLNNTPIDINEYITNGVVQKTGTVFAHIRATGTGLFPNNSDNAVTTGTIQLNFISTHYNLSFDLNGGEGTIPNQSLLEGAKAVAPSNPARTDYTFVGWNTAQNGSGITWDFTTSSMPANDMVLYAIWQKDIKVMPEVDGTVMTETKNNSSNTQNNNILSTGDNSNVFGFSLLVLGAGCIIVITNKKRKQIQ